MPIDDVSLPPGVLEHMEVRAFANLHAAEVALRRVTVFVGAQATGKSVVARLLHVLRGLPRRVAGALLRGASQAEALAAEADLLDRWFPPRLRATRPGAAVVYRAQGFAVAVEFGAGRPGFAFGAGAARVWEACARARPAVEAHTARLRDAQAGPGVLVEEEAVAAVLRGILRDNARDLPGAAGEDGLFVPAGRGALAAWDLGPATVDDAGGGLGLDPALVRFVRLWAGAKRLEAMMQPQPREDGGLDRLLGGRLVVRDGRVRVAHGDGREVDLSRASSGQQELAPLLMVLGLHRETPPRAYARATVEEPEAHLHPMAQLALVRRLVGAAAGPEGQALLLTTHSPYVVTALNNLRQAGGLAARLFAAMGVAPSRRTGPAAEGVWDILDGRDPALAALGRRLDAAVPPAGQVGPGDFAAFHFDGEGASSIIDPETGLAVAEDMDAIGEEIMEEFGGLTAIGADLDGLVGPRPEGGAA
jgi:hypothetical protein